MKPSGLHLLLTYLCTYECDHCFVWGSPRQQGTMTLADLREIFRQARSVPSVKTIYFEGGEPFLYYPILVKGVEEAARQGFQVGIVTNAYWATSVEDAREYLRPLAGKVGDLSLSSDLYHADELLSAQAQRATNAADGLGIPSGVITIPQPGEADGLRCRGRAAEVLTGRVPLHPWEEFTTCPFEDLRAPGRVHVDPLGNVHICQGISLGNIFKNDLANICEDYKAEQHPLIAPLLDGGPAELSTRYDVPREEKYADACHLCYQTRLALRDRFPQTLAPDQVYGIFEASQ
ncbi:MAG: 7-carboxy-7-deazaguanine synthase [Chloroflexi bacterium]|nr:7-carboxy-7-deazaguanine synthase [Chloroflexota bacterium]